MPDIDDALLHEIDVTLARCHDQLAAVAWAWVDGWPLATAQSGLRMARAGLARARETPRTPTLEELRATEPDATEAGP